jgi:very-short-patch-repair endonuclease
MKQYPTAPYSGLRADADPGFDVTVRARTFLPRMPPRAFYFGRTAAALHGLPLPTRFTSETHLHVAVTAGCRRVDALGIIPHHVRVHPSDVIRLAGLPISSVWRTWCDLAAAGLGLGELVAVGDRIIWRRSSAGTIDDLRRATSRYESRRGVRLMRAAIDMLSDRSDSATESELRVAILLAGFPRPLVNAELEIGGRVTHPDLSWPDRRVAIEYEGDHHRTDRDQWHRDIRRDGGYRDSGWSLYRATAEDYRSPHDLLLWLARRLPR